MEKDFWLECWENSKIGFHKDAPHRLLVEHIDKLGSIIGKTIFVPLCGKSLDMQFLINKGALVIGCELSYLACEQFFLENNLAFNVVEDGNFICYKGQNICLYCGDFFELPPDLFNEIDIVYDRAALIALPPDIRNNYVEYMLKYLPHNTLYLLIAVSYLSQQEIGPPFSVNDELVNVLYQDKFIIDKLATNLELLGVDSRLSSFGIESLVESVYLLEHK